jgi:NAD(P)-dependent dehydrogenase (short-subunit alcohol dehydrogenase family)
VLLDAGRDHRSPAALPGTVVSYALDVTQVAALEQAARDFVGRFGPPELVIANAGVGGGTRGEDRIEK